ncbi:MAG: sugar ABC transporter permease [Acetomicrobium flavidum]|uniref:carbohydrate ABC transporter permease n=1 Tax=Bacteria TaxID=2 RepID=UPI000D2F4E3D|nr:sugar ABC transporter permease [Coprothermobacter proteolyticus]MBK6586111.1 sugar ABC transporter permease [Coprothermobacter sp.]NLG95445.1 sugar ABC transporter permease [Acetomicrobium flavidum]
MKRNTRSYKSSEVALGYLLLSPVILLVGFLVLAPVIGTFVSSFYRDITFMPPVKFIGLGNYKRMLADPAFWQSVLFTLGFTVVSVFLESVLGMFFALVINEKFKFRGIMRAVVLIPWAIPTIISAKLWQLMYNYNYGLLNYILVHLHLVSQPINWFGSPTGAFASIVIADVWKTAPFMAILFLAGLQAIPNSLYEAATVDGASLSQQFFKITLPLLAPIIVIALIFRTIDAFRIFDLIYVLTGGGPGGATSSLSIYGFNAYILGDFGFGSAVSVITFLLILVFTIIYLRVGHFQEALKNE